MELSTHKVEVVPVELIKHPNADALSIVKVYGYTVVVRTEDWVGKTVGAYIPPDSMVPDTPEYAFLKGHLRVKAKKFRGSPSFGLLVNAPEGAKLGDNVAEQLGVTHYEPPESITMSGDNASPPAGYHPVYDVESLRRYPDAIETGEMVVITEKIHGANGRFLFDGTTTHCGSHRNWKKPDAENLWWKALLNTPELDKWLQAHPGWTVYGEVYGQVQDLKYQGGINIAVFDLLDPEGNWHEPHNRTGFDLPLLPELLVPRISYNVPYNFEEVVKLAEGKSLIKGANNVREGVVVRPIKDRTDAKGNRTIYKVVSLAYLERA